ncbi:MAG: FKBP-type peptidyl-prolyl cis-trans isomerase [Rhizobium sp.]|nr:FKBP-type peptidyl-prolyl cis-trans isomerase [Rhizobium sp.]
MAANKAKPGVQVTESGLQYRVERAGNGATPTASDVVRVHYKGTLLNGETFDSSYDRGEPAEFGLGQVIPGWSEGVQLMKVGSKYTFWIPAELAYGEAGGGPIPANAMLTFEVELMEIVK